jgi:hypothetical protein
VSANGKLLNGKNSSWGDESSRTLLAFFAFSWIATMWVYRGALNGEFISDDSFYVVDLARNHLLDWPFVVNALNPMSDLKYEIMNYAPLYMITSRIEWAIFGASTFGYHVVNVIFHAINATLVLALLRSAKIDSNWAVLAAAFFALHPANVEAVAWISQLRSILALGCGLGSILALRRYPGLATGLFASGLLFKASTLFALPTALVLAWCARKDSTQEAISLPWLGVWIGLFVLYAFPQMETFGYFGHSLDRSFSDAAEQTRSMAAIGTRYLLMAATSAGVSAFHEPEPVRSWLDPWWLASLPIGAVLLWRIISGVRHGKREAAHWIGAAAAFGPISQIFPFYFGMGDRYLYFILPGLIGATLLWWQDFERTVLPGIPGLNMRWRGLTMLDRGLRIGLFILIAFFANQSTQRARLWQTEQRLSVDAQSNYPNGGAAYWVRTRVALYKGDIDDALREYEGVIDTGYYRYSPSLFEIPEYEHLYSRPEFVKLRRRLARLILDDVAQRGTPGQRQMRHAGSAHFYLGEYDAALEMFEAALRRGGPYRDDLLNDLAVVREAKRRAKASDSR